MTSLPATADERRRRRRWRSLRHGGLVGVGVGVEVEVGVGVRVRGRAEG